MKAFSVFSICIILFASAIFALGYSSCDQPPKQQGEKTEHAKSDKQDCSTLNAAFKSGLANLWTIAHDSHEEVIAIATIFIAIFTVVLGLFTVSLAGSTKALVTESKATAMRQLRAYVGQTVEHIYSFDDTKVPSGKYKIKNVGVTPANFATHHADVICAPYPFPEGFEVPPITTPLSNAVTIFPGGEFQCNFAGSTIFSAAEIAEICKGASGIYIVGEIFYEDVFEEDRRTNFCVRVGADHESIRRLTNDYGKPDLKVFFESAPVGNTAT